LRDAPLLGPLREKGYISLFSEIFERNLTDSLKGGLVRGQLFPWGPCCGNWRGSFTGRLTELH